MTPEEMQQRKREMGLTYEQISKLCGVPTPTVQKIISGTTESPYSYNREAVERVLNPDYRPCWMREKDRKPAEIRESVFAYGAKRQGEYTAEDYYAMPDDQRCELIDGVLYDMASPDFNHQTIVEYVGLALKEYVKKNGGNCLVRMTAQDTKVSSDDITIVQPDIFVLCDRTKIKKQWIFGAPDMIVEVLSKSTQKKDCTIKLNKYLFSGVKEYWIIDPVTEKIICYDFSQETVIPMIYGFNDSVPAAIWGGRCKIDFQPLKDELIDFGSDEDTD